MPESVLTCWTLIRDAVAGDSAARERFARLYEPVIRSYLAARWREDLHVANIDDATQDVFVELFRSGGALGKADGDQPGGFRPFLFGVVRNVALRYETKRCEPAALPVDLAADDTSLAAAFDKAWARALLKEAVRVQQSEAQQKGDRALRRFELLELRFQKGLPVRDIAKQWNEDPAVVHHEYATARAEFRTALESVVAFHHPHSTPAEIKTACAELLALLG